MLRKVIYITKRLGTVQLAMIARELGVNEHLARQVLDELTRLGYLRIVTTKDAFVSCTGCPMRTRCLYRRQPQIWTVTEKGQKFNSED